MKKRFWMIVKAKRDKGVSITDTEAMEVFKHCQRKAGKNISNQKYMEILYDDELTNMVIQRDMWKINTQIIDMFRIGKGGMANV